MPAPTERVQLHKEETAAGGGDPGDDFEFLVSPLDATEDAPEMQGVFLQRPGGPSDQLAYITRSAAGAPAQDDILIKPPAVPFEIAGNSIWNFASNPPGILRLDFQSTTGSAFATYLTHVSTTPALAIYEISWWYIWSYNATNNDVLARLMLNGGFQVWLHQQEPKDAAGSGNGGTNQRNHASGSLYVLLGGGATLTWTLEFASGGGAIAGMHSGFLGFKRVG